MESEIRVLDLFSGIKLRGGLAEITVQLGRTRNNPPIKTRRINCAIF
jgi:hypothetical protein